jgi:hypothetical protein
VVALRVAALYDIHGNLPALEAELADPRLVGVDRLVVGGDVVAGPLPSECLERLRTLGDHVMFVVVTATARLRRARPTRSSRPSAGSAGRDSPPASSR